MLDITFFHLELNAEQTEGSHFSIIVKQKNFWKQVKIQNNQVERTTLLVVKNGEKNSIINY